MRAELRVPSKPDAVHRVGMLTHPQSAPNTYASFDTEANDWSCLDPKTRTPRFSIHVFLTSVDRCDLDLAALTSGFPHE